MRNLLSTLLLSLFSFSTIGSTVYADSFAEKMKQADERLEEAGNKINETKKAHNESLAAYNKGISDRNNSFYERVKAAFNLTVGKGENSRETAVVYDSSRAENAKMKLSRDQGYLETLKAKVNAAKNDLEDADRALRAAQKEADTLKKQQELLERVLQKASLSDKWSDLKFGIDDHNYVLDKVAMQLDQQLIGVYLQEKMHQLLNSNALCSSVNQCDGGQRKFGATDIEFSKMKEIFGSSPIVLQDTKRMRGAK